MQMFSKYKHYNFLYCLYFCAKKTLQIKVLIVPAEASVHRSVYISLDTMKIMHKYKLLCALEKDFQVIHTRNLEQLKHKPKTEWVPPHVFICYPLNSQAGPHKWNSSSLQFSSDLNTKHGIQLWWDKNIFHANLLLSKTNSKIQNLDFRQLFHP